jgi:N-acetylglucosaminyldiphosphoundecaprenol N-acetyl-beta-D-mannosaminyltransferase
MSSISRRPRVELLGVTYDNVTRAEALDQIERFIEDGRSRIVCTPNADHVLQIRTDAEFGAILHRSDLNLADGMAVIYASRILRRPLVQNVGGRLLLNEFAARSAKRRYRMFLLGGRDQEQANEVGRRLTLANPGLIVAGAYAPPFVSEFDETATAQMLGLIEQAKPAILFVGLGTPKQEKWISRNLHRLRVPVSIGVGAAFDIITGRVKCPPQWMTDAGLEWAFRLGQEPGRLWRRYLQRDSQFFWLVSREWARERAVR